MNAVRRPAGKRCGSGHDPPTATELLITVDPCSVTVVHMPRAGMSRLELLLVTIDGQFSTVSGSVATFPDASAIVWRPQS